MSQLPNKLVNNLPSFLPRRFANREKKVSDVRQIDW